MRTDHFATVHASISLSNRSVCVEAASVRRQADTPQARAAEEGSVCAVEAAGGSLPDRRVANERGAVCVERNGHAAAVGHVRRP